MSTSIESLLTRELDLRFIDARKIATEARLSLGIEGYPSKNQIGSLRNEAIRIFQSMPTEEQNAMRQMSFAFEAVKITGGSCSDRSSDFQSVSSDDSSRRAMRSIFRR